MTLYEINDAILNFEYEFDTETGELLNADELDELEMAKNEKIENICLLIKSIKADAKAKKDEIDALTKRMKSDEKHADALEKWLAHILNGERFTTPKCDISFRSSESVDIIDEALVPDKYIELSIVRKPVKLEIRKLLKRAKESGEEVPWARLVQKNNLIIK